MKGLTAGLLSIGVLIGGCIPANPVSNGEIVQRTLLIFHNNTGPMCIEALAWLDETAPRYPGLVIEERLVFEQADLDLLRQLEAEYGRSQGISNTFEFLPIIFFQGEAYSGFNDQVAAAIRSLLESAG